MLTGMRAQSRSVIVAMVSVCVTDDAILPLAVCGAGVWKEGRDGTGV
jgi:hypothetical protein